MQSTPTVQIERRELVPVEVCVDGSSYILTNDLKKGKDGLCMTSLRQICLIGVLWVEKWVVLAFVSSLFVVDDVWRHAGRQG